MYIYKNSEISYKSDSESPTPAKSRVRFGIGRIIGLVAVLAVAGAGVIFLGIPFWRYMRADRLEGSGAYYAAAESFSQLEGFIDSAARRDECYYLLGVDALARGDAKTATSYYFRMTDKTVSAIFCTQLYDYAASALSSGGYDDAIELFSGPLSGYDNAKEFCDAAYYEKAETLYAAAYYSEACNYYSMLPETYADAAEKAEACRDVGYRSFIQQLSLDSAISRTSAYSYLDGYKDFDSYVAYYRLADASWDSDEHITENLETIYKLGDFMDVQQTGFTVERLFGHRWSDADSGYYFEWANGVNGGEPAYNIPGYVLAGYYGLYAKVAKGVMYIGSDEKVWTKQFTFTFEDLDNTLSVTSARTGRTYTLTKEY